MPGGEKTEAELNQEDLEIMRLFGRYFYTKDGAGRFILK